VPALEIPSHVRARTLQTLAAAFYKVQKDVTLSVDTEALPPFTKRYLKHFFELTQGEMKTAILEGDPWFFLAWRAKIAQIDTAAIASGRSVADRWALVRAQHFLSILQEIADKRLVALGGKTIGG